MNNVMSKFLNMGMNLNEVITASTWTPAQVINRTELGHLSPRRRSGYRHLKRTGW